jgi:subtilisin family serine protease
VTFTDTLPVSTAPGGVAVHNNIAYIFGGFDAANVIDNTFIFDISQTPGSRITAGPPINLARSYIPNAVVDGIIYAFGGDTFDGTSLLPQTIAEKLDPSAGVPAWDDVGVADLPIPCEATPAFGFDTATSWDLAGTIVLAGCGQWPDEIAESMLYDVGTDTWDMTFPDLNQARRNHAGAFVPIGPGGYGTPGFWIWGGIFDEDATPINIVEFYDANMLGLFDLLPARQTIEGRFTTTVPMAAINNSGADDTYDLSYGNTQGWVITGPVTVSVTNGDFTYFSFDVEVPGDSICGEFTDVTIMATGNQSDTSMARVQANCVGILQGTITDANTTLPIENAVVALEKPSDEAFYEEAFTDANGDYIFPVLDTVTHTLSVSAYGYEFTGGDGFETITVELGVNNYDVALNAPIMSWSANAYTATLAADDMMTMTFTISNTGSSDLNFSLGDYVTGVLPPPPPQRPQEAGLTGVDQRIYEAIAAAPDGQAEFIILMDEQADLAPAYAINDWDERGEYVYNRLQTTAVRSQESVKAWLDSQGIAYHSFIAANGLLVKGDVNLVDTLAARSDVAYLMINGTIPLQYQRPNWWLTLQSSVQSLSAPETVEWGVARVNADDVWADPNFGTLGEGVVVANIDTGVQWQHPALINQYRGGMDDHDYNWYLPTFGCTDPNGGPCDNDGHGTHTMGTMVGDDGGTNQIGVAPGANWIACKGCEANGCSFEALLACGDWMLAPTETNGQNPDPSERPHIVNNSWGGGGGDFWYGGVVTAWRASGIFPQFSAGNNGPNCETTGSPGDYWMSHAAGATAITDDIAGFSSRGPSVNQGILKPDISAPGANVRSSLNTGGYGPLSGTSMASPHVAGVTALLWSADPSLIGQIENTMWALQQTADPQFTLDGCGGNTGTSHPNYTFGWGIVDAYNAISTTLSGDVTVPWLSVTPMGGVIAAGDSMEIMLVVTAPSEAGEYSGVLQITADEPYGNNDVRIPIHLTTMTAPTAGFTSNTPVELGQTSVFTNTSMGDGTLTYEWDFGDDSAIVTDMSPTHVYTATGVYTVTLTVTNEVGSSTIVQTHMVVESGFEIYLPFIAKNE